MKTNIRSPKSAMSVNRSMVLAVLLTVGIFGLQTSMFAASSNNLFNSPTSGGTGLWDSIMNVIQIISYALYIVGLFWIWTGMKDWKEGNQKEAYQKLGGAVGIFLAPAGIALLRSVTSNVNSFQ